MNGQVDRRCGFAAIAATIVVVLALATAAGTARAGVVENTTIFVNPGVPFFICDEFVTFNGRIHLLITESPAGRTVHNMFIDIVGTGVTSGDTYRRVGSIQQTDDGDRWIAIDRFRGSGNVLTLKTVVIMVDGEPVVDIMETTAECG
jgi:hypothetical protein